MLSKHKLVAKHVALPILGILMIVGNSFLIYVTLRHKHLRTVTAYFIVSLALTDLMMGCLVVPLMVAAELEMFGNSPTVCLSVFCLAISEVKSRLDYFGCIQHASHDLCGCCCQIESLRETPGQLYVCIPGFSELVRNSGPL